MLLARFISNRLSSSGSENGQNTKRITRIAILAVAISIIVMIFSICIVKGFQYIIQQKVMSFNGHAIVKKLNSNESNDATLFNIDSIDISTLKSNNSISHIYPILQKPIIIKQNETLEGLLCKGINAQFPESFFEQNLIKGRSIIYKDSTWANEILISSQIQKKLDLDTGKFLNIYIFANNGVKIRKLKIVGVFNTGVAEIDKNHVITDIKLLQRAISNDFKSIGNYEIKFKNTEKLEEKTSLINEQIPMEYVAVSVKESNFQIFEWLSLLDANVIVVLVLMIIVSIINMVTVILVLIIDRMKMIGILKSIGASQMLIKQIFWWQGGFILLKGLVYGNVIGLLLAAMQYYFKIFKLDQDTYYMSYVPIYFDWKGIILVNIISFISILLILFLPILIIKKVKPTQVLRFD